MKIKALFLILSFTPVNTFALASVKVLYFKNKSVMKVMISPNGTVLSFPEKPTKVILGRKKSFGIEFIKNDLVISPLSNVSRSNIFVYVSGRRFVLDLITSTKYHRTLYFMKDHKDTLIRPKL